jgi:ABC-type uncharacterized transport system substrate-binding protein
VITRRRFLAISCALLAGPHVSQAQQASKVARIGILGGTRTDFRAAFREALLDHGYVDGRNVVIEERSAQGDNRRFPTLATELLSGNVDIIVAVSTPAALAAKAATDSIPIVFAAVGDPVGAGLVKSLGRPGGNVTGVSQASPEGLSGKRVELLKEAAPKAANLAVLWVVTNPGHQHALPIFEHAARTLAMQIQAVGVRDANELPGAFDVIRRRRADALVVSPDDLTFAHLKSIVQFAADNRIPSVYAARQFVEAGGLLSYGISFPAALRAAAVYVVKILKGAKPADLPVEQPTKFELVINLKTAKALGLTIPPSLLLRADQVIE